MSQEIEENPLKINDLLQITVKETREEVPTTYLSRVENISSGDIVISWPTSNGIRAPVREDDILSITFDVKNSIYLLDVRIIRRIQDTIPMLVIRSVAPIQKIQRREYVRVPAMVKVYLTARVVTAIKTAIKEDAGGSDANFITGHTIDLSGSGFAMHPPVFLRVGNLYDVKMLIPERDRPLQVTAKVVRCDVISESGKKDYYEAGFAFMQITEYDRRQIVAYIFRFQRDSFGRDSR